MIATKVKYLLGLADNYYDHFKQQILHIISPFIQKFSFHTRVGKEKGKEKSGKEKLDYLKF